MINTIVTPKNDLLLVDATRRIVLLIKRIVMLEADGNYTIFHLQGGKKRVFAHCLHTYEETLTPYGFIRIHKGYIINKSLIDKVLYFNHQIVMLDNIVVPISRRRGRTEILKRNLGIPINHPNKVFL
jgi:DNA-binding LytR/AlgR family response regulator